MMPSFFEIIEKATESYKYLVERKRQANIRRELNIVYGSKMANLLSNLHDQYPMLKRAKHIWPIAVWNNISTSRNEIDSLLGNLNRHFKPDTSLADEKYLKYLKKQNSRELFNGNTFILENAHLSDQELKINCGIGQYYDAIMTCDSLDTELINAFVKTTPSSVDELLKLCPKRCEFLKHCSDPAFLGDGRSAAIGISTLIAYQHDGRYLAFLRARSSAVATHPGRHHVIPSGMFTTETDDYLNEFSIRHNFYREYQEELFEDRDLKRPSGQLSYNWFYYKTQLQYLMKLLNDGKATLYISGYSINLTNYRPEILLLLIVNENDWANQQISPNYEYADPQELRDKGRDVLVPIDLSSSDFEIVSLIDSIGGGIIPPGAAALWSGKDLLAKSI